MQIIYVDLPLSVHEMVTVDADGDYVIALNARDTYENRKHYYLHALDHIQKEDFCGYDADQIEASRHDCKYCLKGLCGSQK